MAHWTFFVHSGNGKLMTIDQVEAEDLPGAYAKWAQVVKIEGIVLSPEDRMTAFAIPADAETEFVSRPDLKAVWVSACTFGVADDEIPVGWGGHPHVWVVKTDVK